MIASDIAQINLATFAKVRARRAVRRIDGDQSRVLRGLEDSPATRLTARPRRIEPSCSAAVDEPIAVVAVQFDLWVVSPALHSRSRIEGDQTIERSCEIECAVNRSGVVSNPLRFRSPRPSEISPVWKVHATFSVETFARLICASGE